jgi:glycopeptide antibiotics resistance protein
MFFLPVLLVGFVASALVAALVYGLILLLLRRRNPRAAEYLLAWWALLFLFVTQFPDPGSTAGSHLNLVPFAAFLARGDDLVNAGTPTQFVLNIVLTVPLGVLLPVVFHRRLVGAAAIGLAVAVATETAQFFTGRHADIDDVIANTAGMLLGYAAWALVRAGRARPARAAPAG